MIKHNSTLLAAIAISSGLLFSTPTLADYSGPGANNAETNLATILQNPIDDQEVKLEGYIIQKLGKERYLFSDGKNEIQVEIDDKDLPRKSFNEKHKVVIYGEVDKDRKGVEIDVDRIELK